MSPGCFYTFPINKYEGFAVSPKWKYGLTMVEKGKWSKLKLKGALRKHLSQAQFQINYIIG